MKEKPVSIRRIFTILEPWFRNVVLDESNEVPLYTPEALYSGLLGAITAGFMNLPGSYPQYFSEDVTVSQDQVSAVLDFLDSYKEMSGRKAGYYLSEDELRVMAEFAADNIMDALVPGMDEAGNLKPEQIRQAKTFSQKSEAELFKQMKSYQNRVNRLYQRAQAKVDTAALRSG